MAAEILNNKTSQNSGPAAIFQDDDILVIDKPSGWITNSADTTKNQPVVQDWLAVNFEYEIAKNAELRSGIVHRLDKETSGILLIAKTKIAFFELQRQFKERVVRKTYTALVHGRVEPDEGVINAPVGRLPWRRDRFGVLPGGRDSRTLYKVVQYYQDLKVKDQQQRNYSLVEFYPQTGRTHQIRIHAKHIGHPLVADEFYAGRKTARNDRKWCPRLFLHASGISFNHPVLQKSVSFKVNLPIDLQNSLNDLDV